MMLIGLFRRIVFIFSVVVLITTAVLMVARLQEPQLSWVIFVSTNNSTYDHELYRMTTDGLASKRLTYIPGYQALQGWTPDHEWMLVQSLANKLLYHINPTTGELQSRIAMPAQFEAWSSDYEWMIIRSDGNQSNDLFRVRPDGSDLTQLTVSAGTDQFLAWSPDGEWIYVASEGEIWRVRSDGSHQEQLTSSLIRNPIAYYAIRSHESFAAWSPDGEWLVFDLCCESVNGHVRNSGYYSFARSEIFRIRFDGSRIEQLSRSFSFNWIVSLSPDHEWIIFRSDRSSSRFDLYRMRHDGSDLMRLTQGENLISNENINWSDDGKWLTYVSGRNRIQMRIDGSEQQQDTEFRCGYIEQSPDGEWLFYYDRFGTYTKIFKMRPDCSESQMLNAENQDEQFIAFAPVILTRRQLAPLFIGAAVMLVLSIMRCNFFQTYSVTFLEGADL